MLESLYGVRSVPAGGVICDYFIRAIKSSSLGDLLFKSTVTCAHLISNSNYVLIGHIFLLYGKEGFRACINFFFLSLWNTDIPCKQFANWRMSIFMT